MSRGWQSFCCYLEFAAAALEKSAPRPCERGETKIALNYRCRWRPPAREPFTVMRTSAARSREALMSASDNLSTKCSGLLLRSSFAILAARARHLISAAPMPAFSVASRPSNSSDIMRSGFSEPSLGPLVAFERTRFKCGADKLHLLRYRLFVPDVP
jgi:hypothetical protein